ncbi:uncharacterized protein FN964_003231 [Alca torda]
MPSQGPTGLEGRAPALCQQRARLALRRALGGGLGRPGKPRPSGSSPRRASRGCCSPSPVAPPPGPHTASSALHLRHPSSRSVSPSVTRRHLWPATSLVLIWRKGNFPQPMKAKVPVETAGTSVASDYGNPLSDEGWDFPVTCPQLEGEGSFSSLSNMGIFHFPELFLPAIYG